MGKRRKKVEEVETSKKKHKKNKRKKYHLTEDEIESPSVDERESVSTKRSIRLKIKLGDQLISSSNATIGSPDDTSSLCESEPRSLTGGASGSSTGGGAGESLAEGSSIGLLDEDLVPSDISVGKDDLSNGGDDDVGSGLDDEDEEVMEEEDIEEEAWLHALEAGEVNERGYLPQKKDYGTLTARQRAMLGDEGGGSGSPEELLELPNCRSTEHLTEEMLLKKTEKNRKRRLAAQKRKEKRKAETVRKLLEKQSTKKKDDEKVRVPKKPGVPHIRYINSNRPREEGGSIGSTLSLPPGITLPIPPAKLSPPPEPVLCAVDGCGNMKKYSDSLTKLPVCSLQCYKMIHRNSTNNSTCLKT